MGKLPWLLAILMFANVGLACESEKQVEKSIAKEKAQVQVSAERLYADYKENEVKADLQYKGKVLEISGVIDSIGKDVLDTPYVKLFGDQFWGVQCFFAKEHEVELAGMNRGQSVLLKGRGDGYLVNVFVRGCSRAVSP